MPLGGLLPYDDEEERRRRGLPLPPPALPPSPTPLPTRGNPDTLPSPMPSLRPPGRGEQINEARDVYMLGTPGRGKSAAKGALQAFLGGGGLLGAGLGAISGAVDPRGLREQEFNTRVRPQILERFSLEDADRAAAQAAEDRQLNSAYRTAQIGELNRRGILEPPKPRQPIRSDRGLYDLDAGRIIPGTEPLPPAPRQLNPNFEYDVDRLPYNLNDPAERKKFELLPRSKRVKPEKTGTAKPKEKQKFVPLSKIREYAKQKGISRDQAEAEARADGYTIVR